VNSEPYFFLSYAHTPKRHPNDPGDPDRWVCQLYDDLCEIILGLTNAHPRSVGFMDRQSGPGARWPEDLAQALATCKVFVPLYSERYFGSEHCGREWFAFARRELTHRAQGGRVSSAIVPALWADIDPDCLPEVAKSVHYDHSDFGRRYRAEGFYGLIKLKRFRKDYELAVHQLARRIVRVAKETKLGPAQASDYQALQCAFGSPGSAATAGTQLQSRCWRWTRQAYRKAAPGITTARRRVPGARTARNYSQPLVEYAKELAAYLGCQAVVGTLTSTPRNGPSMGSRYPRPVPGGRLGHRLQRCPEEAPPFRRAPSAVISVLVPWNTQDAEMTAAEQILRRGLNNPCGASSRASRTDAGWAAPAYRPCRTSGSCCPR